MAKNKKNKKTSKSKPAKRPNNPRLIRDTLRLEANHELRLLVGNSSILITLGPSSAGGPGGSSSRSPQPGGSL